MSMTDPIADLLTRIRNGHIAGHESVTLPISKMKVVHARFHMTFMHEGSGRAKALTFNVGRNSCDRRAGHVPGVSTVPRAAGGPVRGRVPGSVRAT